MAIDWQDELKKYVVRKHKELTGEELPLEAITDITIDFDVDFKDLSINDLGNMYSFSLMMEKYEFAEKVHNELKLRGCKVDINLDESRKTGMVNIYTQPNVSVEKIEINLKILPNGLMVDFDKLK